MVIKTTRQDAERLFDGILAGDGDIYGRMASAHEGGIANYPDGLGFIVFLLYDSLKPDSDSYQLGRELADEFLSTNQFLDDPAPQEEET
jgi:hypothetical protein